MDADRPDSKIGSRYSISCFAARTSLYKPWAQVYGPSLHRLDFRFPFLRSVFFYIALHTAIKLFKYG